MKTINLILIIGMFICFTMIIFGIHNIDNAFNALKISYDEGVDVFYGSCDMVTTNKCVGFVELYVLGMDMVRVSAVILMLIAYMLIFIKEKK